jgi:hypothetical protein
MIGHQAVCPNPNPVFLAGFAEKFDISKMILIAEKHILSAISSLDNMMRIPRGYYSCDSWHSDEKLLLNSRKVNKQLVAVPYYSKIS